MEVQSREGDLLYIADYSHKIIAMVMVSKNQSESYGPDTKYLHHLYIDTEWRGKGLLKYLVCAIEEKYGTCPMTIMCEPYGEEGLNHEQLHEIYEHMGFRDAIEVYGTESLMMVKVPIEDAPTSEDNL